MLERNGIARDSVKLSLTQVITLSIGMINVMLLSRFRTVTEYGTYSQLTMVSAIVITFFSSGFSQCINFFLADEVDTTKISQFIKTYYFILTLLGLISGLVSLLFSHFYVDYFDNKEINNYLFFLFLYPITNILNNGADKFFIIYKKTNKLILYKMRYAVTSLLSTVIAIVFNLTFGSYLKLFISVEALFAIFIYYIIYRLTNVFPFGFNFKFFKKIIRFALPLGLATLVATINAELDKFVIGGLTDTDTLALYTNVARELPVTIFSTSVSAVVVPHIVKFVKRNDIESALDIWHASIKLTAYVIVFFTVALFVFAPQVISMLYSDKYISGVGIFRIYLITLLFRFTYYGVFINALNRTKIIFFSSILTITVNLIFDYILFKFIGLTGPAWATVLSIFAMNIAQLFVTSKLLKRSFKCIYPWFGLLQIILINVGFGFVFFLLQTACFKIFNLNPIVISVLIGLLWMVTYLLAIKKKIFVLWRKLK